MLPKLKDWFMIRPELREGEQYYKLIQYLFSDCDEDFINEEIITKGEARNILDKMEIKKDTAFYEFYSKYFGIDSSEQEGADLMYSLGQILDGYKNPFWEEYPQIGKRYLQMSSIEGEWSYFYDKETDAMYGVDWNEMDDLVAGKLKPLFTSFYDFLEWYYSEDEE